MSQEKVLVLIVEDDAVCLEIMREMLIREGYAVLAADTGEDGLLLFREQKPSLSLIDIGLPGIDGLTLCKYIREESLTPIIIVTADRSDDTMEACLDAGADDYLPKPYKQKELAARIRAVLHRTQNIQKSFYQFGDLRIDLKYSTVTIGDRVIDLSISEYRMLVYLAHNRDKAVPAQAILEELLDEYYENGMEMVRLSIKRLREKLNDNARCPKYILTIPRQGYIKAHNQRELEYAGQDR